MRVHRQDDALGQWTVAWCEPAPALRHCVAMLWYGEGRVGYQRDRILPGGVSHLLINLGPTQYRIEAGPPERRVPFRDIWYSGLHQGPIDTEAPHGNALLGVAFRACGARPWLRVDAVETADRITPLEDLVGADAHRLRERLLHTPAVDARFAIVEYWLQARLQGQREIHPLMAWALQRIEAEAGQLPVAALAREAGLSRKHLSALFRREVGLSAKTLARLHRFRTATALLGGVDRVPWATLATHCGYFDQSHLVRDFRAFSGLSPGEFLRHARADANSLVLR